MSQAIASAADGLGEGRPGDALEALRSMRIYTPLPCLGFLLLDLLAMPLRTLLDRGGERRPEWSFARVAAAIALVGFCWAAMRNPRVTADWEYTPAR